MWKSPDIKEHVKETSDFLISNLVSYETYTSKNISELVDFDYEFLGDYEEVEVPDFSINALLDNQEELKNQSKEYDAINDINYKPQLLSNIKYDNVLYYQFVLFLNDIFSTADFNTSKLNKINLVDRSVILDTLYKYLKSSNTTIKQINDIDILNDTEITNISKKDNYDVWMKEKIRYDTDINLEGTAEYQRVLNIIGKTELDKIISNLMKYKKRTY